MARTGNLIRFLGVPTITVRPCHPKRITMHIGYKKLAEISPLKPEHFCVGNNIQTSAGVIVANNYWSASTYVPNTTNAWNVNFNNGNDNATNKTNNNYVRCVAGA